MSLSVVQFSFYAERICFTIRVEYLHNRRGERKKERKKKKERLKKRLIDIIQKDPRFSRWKEKNKREREKVNDNVSTFHSQKK